MIPLLIFVILVLTVCLVLACAFLLSLKKHHANSVGEISNLQNEMRRTHADNVQTINNLQQQMHNLAGEQFSKWRDMECEKIRLQEREMALKEANVQLELWVNQTEISIRSDAIQRSHSTILGQVSEHIAPYMPDFKFNPKDVRFIGSPIDLIIFDGMDNGDIERIVFVEVKTGESAALTTKQRQIRDAITNQHVDWAILRINRQVETSTE